MRQLTPVSRRQLIHPSRENASLLAAFSIMESTKAPRLDDFTIHNGCFGRRLT